MLLKLCKIKKVLNFFNQKNAGFIVRVTVYCLFVLFILGGGVNQIVLPGPVKIATVVTGQPSLKDTCSGLVFKDSGPNNSDGSFFTMFQPGQFVLEGKYKPFGSIVKIFTPVSVFAEEVGSKATNETANNTKASGNICYFKGSKFQFYLYASIGGFIGIGISLICIYIFYRFIY